MKILVTGGAGFIGSNLLEGLITSGHEVLVLDNFNDYYSPEIKRRNVQEVRDKAGDFILIEGDIGDRGLVESTLNQHRPEVVIHLAARAGVRPSIKEPQLYVDTNITGTLNLLEAARKNSVRRVVFGSSSSVYGINAKIPFQEDDPIPHPVSPYAASKTAGEMLVHAYHHLYGMEAASLRFFTVYGPRQRPEMAIHMFVRHVAEGKSIDMFGDGKTRRDYTFVSDIVQGIMGALTAPLKYEVFNLGECRTVELRYLIELIGREVGKEPIIRQLPEQPGDVPITFADINKARKMLGYNPQVQIEEGIQRFVRWFKENRK